MKKVHFELTTLDEIRKYSSMPIEDQDALRTVKSPHRIYKGVDEEGKILCWAGVINLSGNGEVWAFIERDRGSSIFAIKDLFLIESYRYKKIVATVSPDYKHKKWLTWMGMRFERFCTLDGEYMHEYSFIGG